MLHQSITLTTHFIHSLSGLVYYFLRKTPTHGWQGKSSNNFSISFGKVFLGTAYPPQRSILSLSTGEHQEGVCVAVKCIVLEGGEVPSLILGERSHSTWYKVNPGCQPKYKILGHVFRSCPSCTNFTASSILTPLFLTVTHHIIPSFPRSAPSSLPLKISLTDFFHHSCIMQSFHIPIPALHTFFTMSVIMLKCVVNNETEDANLGL